MSSGKNRAGAPPGSDSLIGWGSGFRIAIYYVGFFTVVCVALFGVIYSGVSNLVHERELEIVRNRAAEYRAWFISGDRKMLEDRMDEQTLASGDIMFVHVAGPGIDYIKFNAPEGARLPLKELQGVPATAEGSSIEVGGEHWAVASLPVGRGGVVLQAGKNSRAADQSLARLRKLFALTLIPAALVAILGGALLTYRAMSPVRRLTVTIREVLRAGDLGQRVEPEKGSNELNDLVGLFNRLQARNETLIEAMHNSLDSVAHDMRTPLSRLNNSAERALSSASDDPSALREALADCVEESEHLGRLLTTLMDVAEAESGAMRLDRERLSLPDLVESVAELYEFVAEEKSVRIEMELPEELHVQVDRTRLNQVLANLLDNAIKYSHEGGVVTIKVSEDAGEAVIAVVDEGIGICEADLPHVWNRLFRAERSRTAPGMGLGLSFVRAIVEAHEGSVGVESRVNAGSTFTVRLPVGGV